MIDISNENVLVDYLINKKVINKNDNYSLVNCKGGVSGIVILVKLEDRSLIVKQALAKLNVKEDWQCDPGRMEIEEKSNRVYHRIVPDCAPKVFQYDNENYIYIREAAPDNCTMWKTDLMGGLLDFSVAEKSIRSLAMVHNQCAGDSEVRKTFGDKQIFIELRISPYIEFTIKKYPEISAFAQPIINELTESQITLVHADYSPKNILVYDRKICIIDFEVAHYGHPSFDLAFFSNHLILKSVKNKEWADSYINMLKYMLKIYFNEINFMSSTELEFSTVRLLSLLMLARIDGKSPVEYLTTEDDKNLVRNMVFEIINKEVISFETALSLVLEHINQYKARF